MPSTHVAAYHHVDGVELVAGCDIAPAMIEQFEKDWRDILPEARTYTDYREMLAREDLDIVSVVTGDHLHGQIVVDVAEAGVKGIICEKPIASRLDDADRMIEAVDKAGIPMLIDHTRRWILPWAQVAELIRQGEIGDVLRVMGNQGGPRAMLFRNGTHMCDTMLWYASGNPVAVYAISEKGFEEYGPRYASDGGHDPDTDPAMTALVELDNDVRIMWNMCKTMPGVFTIEVFGTKGYIRVSPDEATITYDYSDPSEVTAQSKPRELSTQPLPRPNFTHGWVAGCVAEMVHLVRHGGRPSCDGRDGRKALEVMLAALHSQAKGNVRIELPIRDA
jgi:predicted dehydrogenase